MVIGLTGKSCAGKDEVASILSSLGFYVIDEDRLGHEALDANREALIATFGDAILTNGSVDRKKLGPLVFSDKDKLRLLEAISHPWMVSETVRRAKEAEAKGLNVVINAAILKRLGLDSISDEILFVDAPFAIRAKRAEARNGTKIEDFEKRERNQEDIVSIFETFGGKLVKVINDGDKPTLYRQVKEYCDTILSRG